MRTRHTARIVLVPLLGLFLSCAEKDDSLIDSTGLPPFMSRASLSSDTVNVDTIQPDPSGSVTISVRASAFVEDPNGIQDIARVEYAVMKPGESQVSFSGELAQPPPDTSLPSLEAEYDGMVIFMIEQSDIGNYIFEFFATDQTGLTSNALQRTLTVVRQQNSPPVISNVQAPDTVQLPPTGFVLIDISVDASDPDGLNDIAEVFFRSLDSSDPTFKFQMKDDGDAPSSGDMTAGDGTYTIRIQLDSTNPAMPFRFEFQATDKAGASSNTILHTLNVIR